MSTLVTPELIDHYLSLQVQIATLSEERDALLGVIRAGIPEGTSQNVGDFNVRVSKPAERLNTKAFTEKYPPSEFPRFYKQTVDTAAVRAEMAPAYLQKDGLYTTSAGRVTIQ